MHEDDSGELSSALVGALLTFMWSLPTDSSVGAERAEFIDHLLAGYRQDFGFELAPLLRADSDWEHEHLLPDSLKQALRSEVASDPSNVMSKSLAVVNVVAEQRLLYIDEEKLLGHLIRSHGADQAQQEGWGRLIALHAAAHAGGKPLG